MGEADTKTQLARSIVLAVRAVRRHLQMQPPITIARFPVDKAQHLQLQQQLISLIQENKGVIIDAGFAIPNRLLWQAHSTNFLPFNPNRLVIDPDSKPESGIYISKFEVDLAPRIFLSKQYLAWLTHLSQHQTVYALAQPASELPASRFHEAMTGLVHS
jgi:hypothetical protein